MMRKRAWAFLFNGIGELCDTKLWQCIVSSKPPIGGGVESFLCYK